MSKGGSSTTQQKQELPAWLTNIMQPYLRESVGNALTMQRQGNQVLQGGSYKDAVPYTPGTGGGGGKIDPDILAAYQASRGGA